MKIGRIKVWFGGDATKKYFKSFLGQQITRWLNNPSENGTIHVFRRMKDMKKFVEKENWTLTDYGFRTWWFGRFFLVVRTHSFNAKNSW